MLARDSIRAVKYRGQITTTDGIRVVKYRGRKTAEERRTDPAISRPDTPRGPAARPRKRQA